MTFTDSDVQLSPTDSTSAENPTEPKNQAKLFTFSLITHKADAHARPLTLPWAEWIKYLTDHDVRTAKNGPGFLPATYRNEHRSNEDAIELTAFVIDVDAKKTSKEDAVAVLEATEGFERVVYSTHSHTPEKPCFRVVMPLLTPVPAAAWPDFWAYNFARFTNGKTDPVKDEARFFFLPAAKPNAAKFAQHHAGKLLDPLELDGHTHDSGYVSTPGANAHHAGGTQTTDILPEDFPKIAKVAIPVLKWKCMSHETDAVREQFAKVFEGKSFADEGDRDNTLSRLCGVVAGNALGNSPTQLASLFEDSLKAMANVEGAPTVSDAVEKIARKQRSMLHARAKAHAEMRIETAKKEQAERLRAAHQAGTGEREGFYTDDELKKFADSFSITTETLQNRWVIQKGRAFWFLHNGKYEGPYSAEEFSPAATQWLAPAAEVRLYTVKQNGQRIEKSSAQVVKEYGIVARKIVADLSKSLSKYDEKTGYFFEAVCPKRRLEPEENPLVNEWLVLLGGTLSSKLLDWLSAAPKLDRQCSALYIKGLGGEGKGLLAQSLARIWTPTGSPTELGRVLENFNEDFTRCPFVFVDEAMPKTWKNVSISGALRSLIGSQARTLTRKFMPNAEMVGSVRLFLAANNEHLLDFNEDLSPGDLAALSARFLYIEASKKASKFLEAMPAGEKTRWLNEDVITKHILWLARERVIVEGKRFIVDGETTHMHLTLATQAGIAGLVCEWLTGFMSNPLPAENAHAELISRGGGQLRVNARIVSESWETYVKSDRTPTLHRIGRVLKNLSTNKKKVLAANGSQQKMYTINLPLVFEWAERVGVGDVEQMREALGIAEGADLGNGVGANMQDDSDDGEELDSITNSPALAPARGVVKVSPPAPKRKNSLYDSLVGGSDNGNGALPSTDEIPF